MALMRRVAIVAFEEVQALDVTGPMEVFSLAGQIAGEPYGIEVVAPGAEALRTNSGLAITPDRAIRSVRGPIDTLVVAGGSGAFDAEDDERLVRWIGRVAQRSRRVTSVCTGAFLLARAGLLEGRRAATHWSAA